MDFMDFSRRLYRWASEGVDMYGDSEKLHFCIINNPASLNRIFDI